MKKLLLGLVLLTSMPSFADIRLENLERWQEMLSKGELTEKGFNKLVKKQSIVDDQVTQRNENLTIEDLELRYKDALDNGEITPLGYSKLILKLETLKNM